MAVAPVVLFSGTELQLIYWIILLISMNPASLIRESFDFECPICTLKYNDADRFPMIICKSQHTTCNNCLNDLFRGNDHFNCPFCKEPVDRRQPQRFRLMNEIRNAEERLRMEGSSIRRTIQSLSQETDALKEELINQKEMNEFLIQQIKAKEAAAQKKLQREVSELKSFYESKIEGLEKQNQILEKRIEDNERQALPEPILKKDIKKESIESVTSLDWSQQSLRTVDLSKYANLKKLQLKNNQLTAIDLSSNLQLSYLDLGWNQLTTITLLRNTNLAYINLYENHLQSIAFPFNDKLSLRTIALGNQRTSKCVIDIHHNRNDAERCKKLKDELNKDLIEAERYSNNAYDCRYSFKVIQS